MNVDLLPSLDCPRIDGEVRRYRTPHGLFPSVTTILGTTASKVELDRWRERVGEAEAERIRSEGAERGRKLHNMLEDYLLHGKKGSGPWWDSMWPVLQDVDDVRLIEGPLWYTWDNGLGFAGTADLIASYQGWPVLLDWKTARKKKTRGWINDYVLQACAYAGAANARYADYGLNLRRIIVAVALEDQPAQVFRFDRDEMVMYWRQLTGRVREYFEIAARFEAELFGAPPS